MFFNFALKNKNIIKCLRKILWNKTTKEDPYFFLYKFLYRDCGCLIFLLLVFFQNKACKRGRIIKYLIQAIQFFFAQRTLGWSSTWGKSMAVVTLLSSIWTLPKPAVFTGLHSFQEKLTYLIKKTNKHLFLS